MLNDNCVLKAYIEFVAGDLKDLFQFSLRESEIHRRTNAFNRNKNRRLIQNEYQAFLNKVQNGWGKIYDNSAQFSETMGKEDMILRGGTVYAITLSQRHAEQFFFQLYFALKVYIMGFDDKQFSKMDKSEFFSGIVFGFTRIAMEKAFPTVMIALKNHSISVDEDKKRAFVEINQKLTTDVYIRYNAGEELTDRRIEQILKDMEDEREKKKIEFEEGVKSGRIHVDYASYATKEELRKGLAREACGILASIIGGSSAYYNLLPLLPAIDPKDSTKLIVANNMYAQRVHGSVLEKCIDTEETNALYLGLIVGHVFLNSLPLNNEKMSLNCDEITNKLFHNGVLPTDVPQLALSYIGITPDSDTVACIKRLNNEMLGRFTLNVKSPRAKTPDELFGRISIATLEAFRMGYHAFFRMNHILPGNTFEEDRLILKQLCSQDSKPKIEMFGKNIPQSIDNKPNNDTVLPQKRIVHEAKYWLAENGTIRCLDDDCPEECNLGCPIYAQTLALEYLSKDNFEEAAKLLRKAVDIEPSFADAWNNLAACYGQMGEHKKAFQAYSKSYKILQKPNPLYGMAVATKKMGDKESALMYVNEYTEHFGVDERIKALHAELRDAAPIIPGRKISESDQVGMSSGKEMDNSKLDNGTLLSWRQRTIR